MFYLPGISLIFYLITSSDAVNMKIDGMINLGPNWSYEYRIVGPAKDENGISPHSLARHGRYHLPVLHLQEENKKQDRRDEEKRKIEENRKEEEKLKEEEKQKEVKRKGHKHHTSEEKHSETTPEAKRKKTTKELDIFVSPHYARVTFSSQSESSLDSSDEQSSAKAGTKFDTYDFTTTRRPRKPYKKARKERKSKHRESEGEIMTEDIEEDHRNKKPVKREHFAIDPKANKSKDEPIMLADTTTQITTLRTDEIFSDPHKVADDAKINDFTNHIYKQTLKVFDTIKHKTNQYHLKREVDVLAKSYEDKFREFLSGTRHQKIKTRLGTQKVILNTIDMSNIILKRLINFMIGELDRKGVLRNNVATANIFQQEVDKEQNLELTHACKKFGICRVGSGFSEFLTDVLLIMLRSEDKNFQHMFDSLTEAIKNADYKHVLAPATEIKLKHSINEIEKIHIDTLRPFFMILKNIITHKNRPLIVNTIASSSRVNATLALLEIIDLFDQILPQNEANQLEWNDIKTSLSDFSESKRFDVQEIMETFVKHLKKAVKAMDAESQKIVDKNLNIMLN